MLTNGYSNHTQVRTMMEEATLKTPSPQIPTRVVSSTPGRLRLRVAQSHRQTREMQRIASALQAHPQINSVHTNTEHGSITIYHAQEDGSLDNVLGTLGDLGIIFGTMATGGRSEAAAGVTNAVVDLNKRVENVTSGAVDLRFLFPLGLAALSVRQLLNKGLQFEVIPWYVLGWYAFDSFIKLHGTSQPQSQSE